MTHRERDALFDVVFELNLEYGSLITPLIIDREAWETGLWSMLPIRGEIDRDGVRV